MADTARNDEDSVFLQTDFWNMPSTPFKIKILSILLFWAALPLCAQNAHRDLLLGDRAYRQNDFPEAEQNYRRSELKQPGVQSWFNLGNTLYNLKQYEEAAGYFRKAAEAAPSPDLRARAMHNLGNAQFSQGNVNEAIESYKQALRLQPEDSGSRNNLALAMQQQQAQSAKEKGKSDNTTNNRQPPPDDDAGSGQAKDKPKADGTDKPQPANDNERNKGQSAKGNPAEDGTGKQQPPNDTPQLATQNPQPALNKSEAEKLLQIMEREEQKVQQRLRRASANPPKSSKDW